MKITLLELILKGIPEAAIFTLGLYAFSKNKMQTKQYWAVVIMTFVSVFLLRMLPINHSVNIMINYIFITVLAFAVMKMTLLKSIISCLLTIGAVLVGEAANFFLLQSTIGSQKILEIMGGDPITKVIYTIPSTVVFGAIIFTAYYFNVLKIPKKKELLNFEKER